MLHGGRRPVDVYRRIYSGINGTPMPAFGDALAEEPDTIWHLVHYILSIVEGRDVPGIEDIQPPPPVVAEAPTTDAAETSESADDNDEDRRRACSRRTCKSGEPERKNLQPKNLRANELAAENLQTKNLHAETLTCSRQNLRRPGDESQQASQIDAGV